MSSESEIRKTPPESAKEQAKLNPGGWVYEIRGNYKEDEYVPPEVVVGAWKVNENGEIVGEFIPNPKFGEPRPGNPG
jgi:hypothetical protein